MHDRSASNGNEQSFITVDTIKSIRRVQFSLFHNQPSMAIMTTYAELQQKIAELQNQAEELRKREIAEVITDVKQKISAYGLTAADLGLSGGRDSSPQQKAKIVLKAKYRDPATGESWVGRGATPKWMRTYLDAGRSKEEFLI